MSDKVFYQVIADELKSKTMDTALWTQATAIAEGDPDKTEASYIRLRFIDLKKSSRQQASGANKSQSEIKPLTDELAQLRSNLARKLYSQGKLSLYSTLSLQPDASDEVVATAIADLESRNQFASGISPAEFNYAKSTLGNPALREQYDRRLLDSISNDIPKMTHPYVEAAGGDSAEAFSIMRRVVAILAVALVGYFGMSFYKERNNHELQKESLETQREVASSTIDSTQANIDMRSQAMRMAEERQKQEMDLRTSATDRMIEQQRIEQERRAQEQERRAQAEQERLKMQHEQAENLRISREKQYYACLNQQLLSQRGVTNSDAYARCAMYH